MKNINSNDYWDGVWLEEEGRNAEREYPELFPYVIARIPERSSVVDIGCGTGFLLERIKKQKNAQVFGLDISLSAIKVMKEKRGIDGVATPIPPIPLKDDTYDVAICTEVLDHLDNDQGAIKEAIRITKPGGLILVTVPNNRWGPEENPEHMRTYTKESLEKLFKGCRDVKTEAIASYLLLSATKPS